MATGAGMVRGVPVPWRRERINTMSTEVTPEQAVKNWDQADRNLKVAIRNLKIALVFQVMTLVILLASTLL